MSVTIQGLTEFRAALRAVNATAARELTKALRAAGAPVLEETRRLAPARTGELRAGYKIRVSGPRAFIESAAPHGPGAEWGQSGKWRGFARYGPRGGRFAGKAAETKADEVFDIVTRELSELISIGGWAR